MDTNDLKTRAILAATAICTTALTIYALAAPFHGTH